MPAPPPPRFANKGCENDPLPNCPPSPRHIGSDMRPTSLGLHMCPPQSANTKETHPSLSLTPSLPLPPNLFNYSDKTALPTDTLIHHYNPSCATLHISPSLCKRIDFYKSTFLLTSIIHLTA